MTFIKTPIKQICYNKLNTTEMNALTPASYVGEYVNGTLIKAVATHFN